MNSEKTTDVDRQHEAVEIQHLGSIDKIVGSDIGLKRDDKFRHGRDPMDY